MCGRCLQRLRTPRISPRRHHAGAHKYAACCEAPVTLRSCGLYGGYAGCLLCAAHRLRPDLLRSDPPFAAGGRAWQSAVTARDRPGRLRKSISKSCWDFVKENYMQRSDFSHWAALPMRILVGYGFIEHGFAKLSRGPDAFAGILQQLGVPLPHVATWLTIGTELVGGLALLLGAFVVWASIPTASVLLVAM